MSLRQGLNGIFKLNSLSIKGREHKEHNGHSNQGSLGSKMMCPYFPKIWPDIVAAFCISLHLLFEIRHLM
jgi:hypothetical protein